MESRQCAVKIDQRPVIQSSLRAAGTYNIEGSLLRPRCAVITHILARSIEIQGNETIIEEYRTYSDSGEISGHTRLSAGSLRHYRCEGNPIREETFFLISVFAEFLSKHPTCNSIEVRRTETGADCIKIFREK